MKARDFQVAAGARVRRTLLALCVAAIISPAHACGPDFAPELLSDRAATMANLPAGMFFFETTRLVKPQDTLRAAEPEPWSENPVSPEGKGLSEAQRAQVEAIRNSGQAADVYTLGADLPPEVQYYLSGALAFHADNPGLARAEFERILELPAAERQLRGVWAAFMLGRLSLIDGDMDTARQYFQQARELHAGGAPDPAGLAIGSWGALSQVLLAQGDYPGAIAGYAEQAARGDQGGSASLLIVARRLLRDRDALNTHIGDPLVQQLVSSFAYSQRGFYVETYWDDEGNEVPVESDNPPPAPGTEIDLIVAAVDQAGLSNFAGADRLAAAAYGAGRYELAERFLKLAQGPLASWVDAKMKLRAGDQAGAAASLAAASKAFAPDETWRSENGYDSWPLVPQCRVAGEEAVLKLARGEYVAAAEDLFRAGLTYWNDLAYVAERVLTVDELAALTTRIAPAFSAPDAVKSENYEGWPLHDTNINNKLRYLTARRLLRAGKPNEAIALFDDATLKQQAQTYADALGAAQSGDFLKRARKLSEAADMARRSGMELLGFEGDPDYSVYSGSFDLNDPTSWDDNYQPIFNPRKDRLPTPPFVGPDEPARLAQSVAQPLERFHYRHVAAKLAQDAAALVPPRSQAYAALMCKATSYVVHRAPASAEAIYREYLDKGPYVPWGRAFGTGDSYGSACPAPDFDKAQAQLDAARRAKLKRIAKYAGPPVLGVLLLGVGFWWWRRRKRVATT